MLDANVFICREMKKVSVFLLLLLVCSACAPHENGEVLSTVTPGSEIVRPSLNGEWRGTEISCGDNVLRTFETSSESFTLRINQEFVEVAIQKSFLNSENELCIGNRRGEYSLIDSR